MSNITMKAKDTLCASLAECFVTIGTRRYNSLEKPEREIRPQGGRELVQQHSTTIHPYSES